MTLYRVTGAHPSNGEGEICTVETDSAAKAEAYYRLAAGGIPSSWIITVTPLVSLQLPQEDWDAIVSGIESWAGRAARDVQILQDVIELPGPPATVDPAQLPPFAVDQIEGRSSGSSGIVPPHILNTIEGHEDDHP